MRVERIAAVIVPTPLKENIKLVIKPFLRG